MTAQPQTRLSGWALLGWIGFVLVLFYATLLGGGHAGTQAVPLRLVSLFIVVIGLLIWALLAWRQPRWRPSTAIWPAIVVPLGAMALTTLLSPFPRLGIEYLAWAVLLFALYLLLVRIVSLPTTRARIGGLAALLAFVVGIAYVGLVLVAWVDWWGLVGQVAAPMLRPSYAGLTFGGPNIVAPVMVLLTAAAFGGIPADTRGHRIVLATLAVLMLLVVLLAASRASWLALGLTIVLVGTAWLIANRARLTRLGTDRNWRRVGIGALIVAVPIAVVVAPAVLGRLAVSGDGGRSSYFAAALRMFEASPLSGGGIGTWAVRRAANTEASETDWYVNHAHNVYLQTLAEQGLIGAVAGIIAIAAVGWLVWRGLRAIDADRRRWAWAALFGLVYLGLHNLLDFYANMPVVLIAVAIPVAVLDATSERRLGLPGLPARAGRITKTIGGGVLVASCILAVLVLYRTESVASVHQQAVLLAADGDSPEEARTSALAAVTDDPDMIPYLVTYAGFASADGDWQIAHDAYQQAATTDDLPANWLGLAQAQIELGMADDEVVASLERALRLGERQPSVVYAAAYLFDRLDMSERADAAYSRTIALVPSLAADPSWTSDPKLAPRSPAIIDSAMERVPAQAWLIALMAGDESRARALTDAAFNGLVIDAWTGDTAALKQVQNAADAAPRNGTLLSWAARLSDRAGDLGAADRYRRLGSFDNDTGVVVGEVRVGGTDTQDGVVSAVRTDLYGQMLYRRPLPVDLLAPGLPRLVYLDERLDER